MTTDRRSLLQALAALGIGTDTFHRALAAQAPPKNAPARPTVTPEMVKAAEWVAGIELTDAQRSAVAGAMTRTLMGYAQLRAIDVPNEVAPAFAFIPDPSPAQSTPGKVTVADTPTKKPASDEDLAYLSIPQLGHLLRTKQISSVELTKFYLERLKKYGPPLLCVVSLTEEIALKQAKQADEELAQGKIRGPLHGIPWGAKDLIAYPGAKTTWGAEHYKDQVKSMKATVAERLDQAGAVLVAKLTLGALAMGDEWFGGMTRNPWDVNQGSSGSSAGSASAVVAGLVPFAIGSETYGSIISPATRCGATALRPTFGRVSRSGCMTLSWTLDKLGPFCRSVNDCAIVLGVIHGADPADIASVTRPFDWPSMKPLKDLRVGLATGPGESKFEKEAEVLRKLGANVMPIQLPKEIPLNPLLSILNAECAAAFDPITRAGVDQGIGRWSTTFRQGEFVSAVEYLRAQRVRSLLIAKMSELMTKVNVYLSNSDLLLTNMTGHPTICMPNGLVNRADGKSTPLALTMTGRLFGETDLLHIAQAYQEATGHHIPRPPLDKLTKA